MTPLEKQIADILKNNITFSGQLGDYVIHGAIEKIVELMDEEMIKFSEWLFYEVRINPMKPEFEKLLSQFRKQKVDK